MNRTPIPWVKNADGSQGFTWNPTTGCTFGCEWCYARKIAARFCTGRPNILEGVTCAMLEFDCRGCSNFDGPEFTQMDYRVARDFDAAFPHGFFPTIYPHRLDEPLRRKIPSTILIGSVSDVFDPAIPDEFRDRIFATVAAAHRHTFVVLTKRAEAMRDYFSGKSFMDVLAVRFDAAHARTGERFGDPLPNLVIGVSVTNQADADERIPLLLDTPAARRMVSVEPMLGPLKLFRRVMVGGRDAQYETDASWYPGYPIWFYADKHLYTSHRADKIDFVAVGGKTPGKPLHEDWAGEHDEELPSANDALRSLRDQCLEAGVLLHYKAGSDNPPLDGVVYDEGVPL